jgi:hypothetical protein
MRSDFMCGQGAGVAAEAFGQQRGEAHLAEKIESVVAGGAISTETHVNAVVVAFLPQARNR